MIRQICDTFFNILISFAGASVVVLTAWCIPRIILRLPALPSFPISWWHLSAIQYLGFVPITMGASIILWCYWYFIYFGKGTPAHFKLPKKLVIKGLYRFVRNPQLIGYDLLWIGNSIFYQSFLILYISVIQHIVFFELFLVPVEEQMLESRFGESYKHYCNHVPRWIPKLTPYEEIS